MLGAIAGDIIGSVHEFAANKSVEFELFHPDCSFTDDTVLAVAVADCLLHGRTTSNISRLLPRLSWPRLRRAVLHMGGDPRTRAVPQLGQRVGDARARGGFRVRLDRRRTGGGGRSAEVTHNHPEGIKGAEATAVAIVLARTGARKDEIRATIADTFGYDLNRRLDDIRPQYEFNESCQQTVPEAMIAFLESTGYEDAVRKAISLGGDADTLACITGGIAEAYYGHVPEPIATRTLELLDNGLRDVVLKFRAEPARRT